MGKRIPMRPDKQKPNESQVRDQCQTPDYALEPLLPYLAGKRFIWEPAAGEGRIVRYFEKAGHLVIPGDILTGQNFFTATAPQCDALITNPPFSVKYPFIARAFEICVPLGLPFALLIPVSAIGAAGCNQLMAKYESDTGIILPDKRIDYYMPNKGDEGTSQFPSLWLCYKLLDKPIVHVKLNKPAKRRRVAPVTTNTVNGVYQPELFEITGG